MAENNVENMLESAVKNIRAACDANSVVGDAVTTPDGTVIVPISKVSFGFGGGGSDFEAKNKDGGNGTFAGGIGGGASIKAEAFLVINNGNVRLITMDGTASPVDRIIEMIPEAINTVNGFISKRKDKKQKEQENFDEKDNGDITDDYYEG